MTKLAQATPSHLENFERWLKASGASLSHEAKLLRAAAAAERHNAVLARPWLAPPAYAPSTAYKVGEVVSNGGRWYMAGIAGTSPASGGGPVTTTGGGFVQDGTSGLYWALLGGAILPDAADGAPTVTVQTANPNLGLGWFPVQHPNSFRVRGGSPIAFRTNYWDIDTFSNKVGAAASSLGSSVVFASDADKIDIFMPTAGKQRVLVDGRYLQPGSTTFTSDTHLIIDWSATTGRRMRTYEVELIGERHFGYVQTDTRSIVTATRPVDEVRMAWISDSYAAGSSYGPFLPGGSIPSLVGKRLGWRDVWNFSTGGTGYINTNAGGGGPFYTYRERVPQVLASNPDVIVLMGSTNDNSQAAGTLTAEVAATLTALRAGTDVPIIVVGSAAIGATTVTQEAAVAAAVTAFDDPLTFFVPNATAAAPWLIGTWNASAAGVPTNAAAANSGFYLGGDGVHPPEMGYGYYAARIEQVVRASILPVLAGAGT